MDKVEVEGNRAKLRRKFKCSDENLEEKYKTWISRMKPAEFTAKLRKSD